MRAEWLSIVLIATLALLAWWLLPRRRSAPQPASGPVRARYLARPLIATDLMPMLGYLHTVFPGQPVLTRVPLGQLLAPVPDSAAQAQAALQPHTVDYVVCDHQGMPQFAFDLERYHLSKAEEHDAALKQKNRMLRSAGIRLIFLRQSVDRMPRPADLRRQLDLADLREAGIDRAAASHRAQMLRSLKQQLDAEDSRYSSTRFREAEVMGLSGLMELGQAEPSGEGTAQAAAPHWRDGCSAERPAPPR